MIRIVFTAMSRLLLPLPSSSHLCMFSTSYHGRR